MQAINKTLPMKEIFLALEFFSRVTTPGMEDNDLVRGFSLVFGVL